MLPETLFRSEDVPAAERFECFSELMGRTHAPLQLLSDHREDFRASQRLLTLGDVSVWPTTFQPVCFRRTPKLIRQSDPEGVHISLPLRGTLRVTSREHEAAYDPSHLCVLDTSQPVDVRGGDLSRPHTGVGVEVPKALLSVPPNEISKLTTLQLSAKEGYGALIAKLLTQLAADSSSYKPTDGPRLGLIMTDLLSALFSQALDADNSLTPETRRRSLVLRIQAFIQQHLHDPQLTGTYGWAEAGGGTYNTWGSATLVNHPANCGRDWAGQLQYYDATRPSWGWHPLALVLRGQTRTVSLDFKYVLDVRFRVCNIFDGKDDGCGRVQ